MADSSPRLGEPKIIFQKKEGLGGFRNYVIAATLLIIFSALGYGLYSQTILKATQQLAYSTAASPVTPGRFLSFQGRLTDSSGNPIVSNTPILFKLYDTETVGTGTSLYTSGTGNSQTVTPDENGIFSVVIGKSHGIGISSSVFSENANVYLEITSDSETMDPRQQIATVGYALNSETLQGLPPSASGFKNTVLVIDGSGNLNLGETSPTIYSQSGTMALIGQALLIGTSDGSGGNITINPDGAGKLKLLTEGAGTTATGGFIEASNANLATGNLYSGYINNDNRGYNFLDFSNYNVGTTLLASRFSVSAGGNLSTGGTISFTGLNIGTTGTGTTAVFIDASGNLSKNILGALAFQDSTIGTTYAFTNGLTNTSNTISLGGTLTTNTQIGTSDYSLSFIGLGGTQSLFIGASGYVGIGTTNPTSRLHVVSIGTTNAGLTVTGGSSVGLGTNNSYSGQILLGDNSGAQGRLSYENSANGNLFIDNSYNNDAGNIYLRTKATNYALTILGSGNVGIGTTNPTFKLSTNGSQGILAYQGTAPSYSATSTDIFSYNDSGNSRFLIGQGTASNYATMTWNYNSTPANAYFSIATPGSQNIILSPGTGNVGIGTTNPLYKFEVNGVANVTQLGIGGTTTAKLNVTGDANITTNLTVGGTPTFTGLAIGTTGTGTTAVFTDASGNLYKNILGALAFQDSTIGTTYTFTNGLTNTSNTVSLGGTLTQNTNIGTSSFFLSFLGLGNTQGLFQSSTGNVGVGTTNPLYKLEVAGDVLISTRLGIGSTNVLYNLNVGGTTALVDSHISGRVGIGTTGPVSKLQISDTNKSFDTNGNLTVFTTDTATNDYGGQITLGGAYSGTSQTRFASIAGRRDSAASAAGYLQLTSANTTGNLVERVRIDSSGNVGIGTTAPGYKLDVNGVANVTQLGIGGTSTSKLNVIGDANITTNLTIGGSLTAASLPVGTGTSIAYISSTGIFTKGLLGPYDNYQSWNLLANSTGSTAITTAANVNFVNGVGISLSQSGSTITINNNGVGTTYTAGVGISLSSTNVFSNIGVTSVLGTTNQINVSNPTGAVTLSLPQNINVGASVTFARLGLGSTHALYLLNVGGTSSLTDLFASGRVGIGTTAPATTLEIKHPTSDTALRISTIATGQARLEFAEVGSTGWSIGERGSDDKLYISNSLGNLLTSPVATIDTNGNLGIGTTAPSKKLDIAGDINLTGTIFSAGTSGSSGQILTSTGTGLSWVNASGIGGTYTAGVGISLSSTNVFSNIGVTSVLGTTNQINVSNPTGAVTLSLPQNINVGASVTFARLGLGSTNALYLLNVGGTANFTNLFTSGNVGVGTTVPRSKLSFGTAGAVSTADTIRLYDDGASNWYSVGTDSVNSALRLTAGTSGHIGFFTGASGGTEKMRIDTSGNVGIGTTSPLGRLAIEGAIFSRGGLTSNLLLDPQFSQTATYWSGLSTAFQEKVVLDNGDIINGLNVGASNTNIQVYGDYIPVDPYKTYRFTLWAKENNNDSTLYFGYDTYNSAKTEINSANSVGTTGSNNYFWSGDLTTNTWRKLTGYLFPCNTGTGWTNPSDTTSTNYRFDDQCTTAYVRMRFLNYDAPAYGTGIGTTAWFATPSVEEVQQIEPVFSHNYSDYIINPYGNVGLGTTAPSKKLDVSGDINLTGTIFSAGTSGSSGQILTSTGTGLSWVNASGIGGTYTAGVGISLSSTNVFSNIGVTSVLGTTNQINVSNPTGAVTLSLPQNINVGASVTFARLGLGSTHALYLLNVGGTSSLTDLFASGRVGIGTTNPLYLLHLSGGKAYFAGSGSASSGWTFGNSYAYEATTTNTMTFETNNKNIVFSPGTGYVGIGTTNPLYDLEVNGDALIATRLGIGTTNGLYKLNVGSSTALVDVHISGRVGIGTTAPGTTLEVSAAASSNPTFQLTDSDVAHGMTGLLPTNSMFRIQNWGSSTGGAWVIGAGDSDTVPGLTLQGAIGSTDPRDTTPALSLNGSKAGGVGGTGYQAMGTSETVLEVETGTVGSGTKLLTILGSGNVGLGTTNPIANLDVIGDLFVGTGSTFSNAAGWSTVIDSYGASHDRITSRTSSIGLDITTHNTGWGGAPIGAHILTSTNHALSIGTSNLVRMTVLATGNVGIGTTAPSKKLDVSGDINLTGTIFSAGTSGSSGQVLTSTGVGLSWVNVTAVGQTYSVTNGLSIISANVFGLGGTLTQNTNIGTSSFGLSFLGLGNSQALFIGASGYVGIGTTNPTVALNIAGGLIASPPTPILAGTLADSTNMNTTQNIDVQGRYAYVVGSGNTGSFSIVDVSNPTIPVLISSIGSGTTAFSAVTKVLANGNYAYVASQSIDQIAVVDISNPSSPSIIGSVSSATQLDGVNEFALSGKYLFATDRNDDRITAVDISNPYLPTIVGSSVGNTLTTNDPFGIYVQGKYAYVAVRLGVGNTTTESHLQIFDISNPTNITAVGTGPTTPDLNDARQVFVSGKYAYVVGFVSKSLAIFDVSNPSSPTLVSTLVDSTNLNAANDIKIAGKYAYITGITADRFTIVDISDPTAPTIYKSITSTTYLDGAARFSLNGRYAYIASSVDHMLTILDLGYELPSLYASNLSAGSLFVEDNINLSNTLRVGGGTIIGGDLLSHGFSSYLNNDSSSTGYAGYFSSVGSTGGSGSKSIALYASATGSDNNYAAIFANGNVGIGTTNPLYNFHVNGDALIATRLGIGSTNSLYNFNVGGTANFTDSFFSGKVAIGITAPGVYALNVGATTSTGSLNLANTAIGGSSVAAYLSGNSGLIGYLDTTAWDKSGANDVIAATNGLQLIGTTSVGIGGSLTQNTQIGTSSFDLSFIGLGGTQSLFVDSTGDVGIGTNSPSAKLAVSSTLNATGTDYGTIISVTDDSAGVGGTLSTVTREGLRVGYTKTGTANLASYFSATISSIGVLSGGTLAAHYGLWSRQQIGTSGTVVTNLYDFVADSQYGTNGTVTNRYGLRVLDFNRSVGQSLATQYGVYINSLTSGQTDNFALYTASSTKSYFGGNVGIGTTNPGGSLQVGTADSGGTGPVFVVQSDGDVGVGTTNPISELTVVGTITSNKYASIYDYARYYLDPGNVTSTSGSLALHGNGSILFNSETVGTTQVTVTATASTQLKSFANGFGIATNIGSTGIGATISWGPALFVNNSGDVGIGTTAPKRLLDISDSSATETTNLRLTNSSWVANQLNTIEFFSGTAGTTLPTSAIKSKLYSGGANGELQFWVNSASTPLQALTIGSSGFVGIGTTSAKGILHLSDDYVSIYGLGSTQTTTSNLIIQGTGTTRSPGNGASLGFVVPANTDGTNLWEQARIIGGADNATTGNATGRLTLQTRYLNGTWQWRDNLVLSGTNGYVGIGTTAPQTNLEISAAADPSIRLSEASSTTSYSQITDTAATQMTIKKVAASGGSDLIIDSIPSDGASTAQIRLFRSTNTSGRSSLDILLGTNSATPNSSFAGTGNSYINANNGNVGIGTTSPGAKLEVHGDNTNIYSLNRATTVATATQLTIGEDTNTPDYHLQLGYFLDAQGWKSVIQSRDGTGGPLLLNPDGGNVGIGTTNPGGLFQVGIADAGGTGPVFFVKSTGNIGIGTTNPTEKLHIVGGNILMDSSKLIEWGGSQTYIQGVGSSQINFQSDNTTRMVLKSGLIVGNSYINSPAQTDGMIIVGKVGIGNTTPGTHQLSVTGTAGLSTGTLWTNTSDSRVKQDINTIADGLDTINQLHPAQYMYTSSYLSAHPEINDVMHFGFIAQEFQQVFPNSVSTGGDGYLQVNQTNVIPYTVKAIQELNVKLADISITTEGQILVESNISESVLASLGYDNAKNEIEAATYSLSDSLGKPVTRLAQFAQVSAAKITAGLVKTTNLIAKNIVAETTKSKTIQTATISPLSDISDTIVVDGNLSISKDATVSGTLYANNIVSQEITNLRDQIRLAIASIGTTEAISTPSALVADSNGWTYDTGTSQVNITGSMSLADNLVVGARLTVIGDTQLGNAFITGTFTAGQIAIKDNLVETTATALYLQPSGLGSVDIMNHTLIIAENGEVALNGNLAVSGKVSSNSLFASLIAADEVNTKKINIATESATIIAIDNSSPEASSSASLSTNASAGTITLPAGKTELIIQNSKITDSSIIYLTPVGSTSNQVVYVKNKVIASDSAATSSFTIAIDTSLTTDVNINWWIIN